MTTPSPILNNGRTFLVLNGRLTKVGKDFLKLMSVYNKANRVIRY